MSSINHKTVYLIGSASGAAAADAGCYDGPFVLKKSPYLAALSEQGVTLRWKDIFALQQPPSASDILPQIANHCTQLATSVAESVRQKQFFTVLGGDHSCAIGTWSGVSSEISKQGSLGLIWIDAHMDSHTPETSLTGNIHGMPLACLLGFGDTQLTHILGKNPKLKPEHVCLIGVRSYESGEAELLRRLNVRIYFMDEVQQRGLDAVMAEALTIVKRGTVAYGVTIDLDSIDPQEAPGTGVSEPDGLSADALCDVLARVVDDNQFIGAEIVEFDPHLDKNHITEKLAVKLLASIT